jgi:hypothetical protein
VAVVRAMVQRVDEGQQALRHDEPAGRASASQASTGRRRPAGWRGAGHRLHYVARPASGFRPGGR